MNVRRPSQRSELAIDLQNRLSSRIGFTVRRDAGWGEIGLDSVMACAFLAEINAAYGCALTPEILHQHSTLSALATFLDRLGERRIRAPSSRPASIAVIGMAGRFPDADTPAAFWENLANGKCSVTPIPEERRRYWDPNGLAAREGSTFGLGAFLSDVECFDPLFFGISPKEAAVIDPQQRIFLEEAWKAFEDAGYAAPMLSGTRCGVYAGVMVNDYHDLLTQAGGASVHELMDTASFLPARIAYHLNLKGPALAVDTASSSSLVAIDLACRALAGGEVDLALAGGATLYLSQKRYTLMEKAGMLASGGKCRVFDTAADGMMPGEAVGVVVLKRLDDALRDRDAIHGVILASGTSQSGRTVGITAPSVEAQAELMEAVYREGGIDPASITLVEAHGTGTRLGDPAEAEALTRAYRSVTTPGAIALGSLKANVGHSFAAAGVSGLIKVLMAMKHRRLPPQIHLAEPQPLLAPGAGPFRLLREPEPWEVPGGGPRRAAICGVGFSGTNAHLVVEEAPAHPLTVEEPAEGYWFTLSAPEAKALERRAKSLLEWMRTTPGWSLPEVSFTLSTGRNALEERLAFRASGREEAEGMLAAFLKGERSAGCFRARTGKTSGPGEPHEWVHGADVDWTATMEGRQARRVHLPADPLDGAPYWYDKGGSATPQRPRPLATPATAARSGAATPAAGRSPIRLKPLVPVATPMVPVDDVLATVRALVARTLYLEVAQVRDDRRFQELGFDSILAVDLAKAVGATFGIPFPAASLYDYPNVQALAEHLASSTAVKAPEPETPLSPPVPVAEPPVPGDGLAREVAALAAGVLYIDAGKVRPESRFADFGLDSILAVELARGIAARWQIAFSAAELYSYPTPLAVARFIQGSAAPVAELPVTRAAPLPPPPPPVVKVPSWDEPLAIIGYAGRFPGAADAEAFWEQIAHGRSAIGDETGRGWGKPLRGGWLDGIDRFDAPFFQIARPEAEVMDPQHRLLLEVAWSTLEHAGRTPEELAERICGIFIGMGASDYAEANVSPHALLGNTGSGLTARLAFLFDWKGPTMVVDTACASSLSALYLACRSLQNGECDAALVGGVHVASTPRVVEAAGSMGLLSPTGSCRTFDARADGFLIGEGVGAVLVKRLADAERDGDTIHGVIRGIGVSQDGARHGMSAPQASGQTRLQKEVYERAGVDPASLQYVEFHGMSSTLSDEIELLALKESFAGAAATLKPGAVALGSLKPNIGHPLAASGMAGLLKLLLALRHRQLPPVGGLETPNPAFALETTPFRLPTTLCPWEGSPRRAALNGLSATGTNAHLVLEEAAQTAPSQGGGPVLFVLSARTRTALERRAAMLRDALAKGGAGLAEVAWTLQVGRRAMEERLAFVARSVPEACDALARFLGEEGPGFTGALHTGRVAESDAMVDLLISGEEGRLFLSAAVERGAFDKLARLWVAGAGFDFRLLHPGSTPRRVALPTYPFEGEHYWHAAACRSGAVATTGPVATGADAGASLRDWIGETLRLAPGELTESRSLNALGFGSLYAMSVAARYEAAYGVRLPLRLFYEARTVGDLCRAVSAFHPVAEGAAASLPLSEGQRALWGLHFSDPCAYLLPVAIRLERGEPERITAALQSLVEEHPALRTTFGREEGEPVRRVLAGFEVKLEEASPGTLREMAARPLEMEGRPLWRASWLPRGSGGTLLCVFHHLIFDGQSLGLFLEAFHERLAVLERGGPLPRRTVVDDAPFFARESRYLESPRYREDRDWWLARHPRSWRGGLFPQRSAEPSEGGALWVGDLPAGLIRRLKALAERERVTLQAVMLAAFEAILGAEPRELTLGIPVDLRPEAEAGTGTGPIGYFINLIALPSRWRGDAPFAEWCRERFAALLDALDHRAFPYRHLAQALAAGDGGAPPALEAAFYFLTWPNATRRRHFEALERGIHQSGEFPLVAEVIEGSEAWRLHFKYQPVRLDADTVERLATTYLAVLEAVAETPGRLLSTLPKPMAEPKTAPMTFPSDRTIARLIEEQAGRTPDAVAAVFEGESLTYAALDAEANRWAHELVARGVKPGMLVGLLWPRSLEMLVGLLAIWKAGAAYVPLDPGYPTQRIAMIVEDARLPFLLLPPGERGPEGCAATLLSPKREDLAARPATPPSIGAEAEERLAYVIFTSGSTGRPKGVRIAHRSLAHFLWCMAQRPGCGPGDRVLALTTISFDIAALELFLPLVSGARVEIVPESVARNGVRLREAIERIRPTIVQATPASWKMLLLAKLPAMPGLKALCGGEAWDETLAGELLPRVGELWNLYGPTETTIWSSIARVLPGEPVRLGEPIGNTAFYVLDEALHPVPRGEIGELYIGGEGLAKGYLHRPDLTRERFIPHPERPGELIYRTGDLVRYV